MIETTDALDKGTRRTFFGFITALYVAFQLISDVTAGKLVNLFEFVVPVSILWFPFTYIFSDILTEVYGYVRARSALWTVLLCSVLAGVLYVIAATLPAAPGFDANEAYKRVLYQVPRILFGGWIAVFTGEFLNDYAIAKLKVFSEGKHLWARLVTSTLVGQLANSILFASIALYGVIPNGLLVSSVLSSWVLKVVVEVVMIPITYRVVAALKRVERIDVYDRDTNFNPFVIHLEQ
ncbi:MAG TPA: queuosine precursor transporter [Candidatus Baltobacteraceae bacterium]|jgi:hypothetical protein|nr:queuosine precursor transporter [Candidatus Baltobacteraceae bacterium]